jgi:NAD(P)H dehydrogenase (quinone)
MDWKTNVPISQSEGPLGFIKKPIAERMVRNKTLKEITQMVRKNKPKDVLEQQKKVEWADGIVLISPIIWMNLPAIMKGWLTRVFQYGFAYALKPEGWAGDSGGRIMLTKLDKALRMNSTFFSEEDYRSKGWYDAISKIIDDWSLRYVGIKKVENVYFYAVGAVSAEKRKEYLEEAYRQGRDF